MYHVPNIGAYMCLYVLGTYMYHVPYIGTYVVATMVPNSFEIKIRNA